MEENSILFYSISEEFWNKVETFVYKNNWLWIVQYQIVAKIYKKNIDLLYIFVIQYNRSTIIIFI